MDKVVCLANRHFLASLGKLDQQLALKCFNMGGIEPLSQQSCTNLKASAVTSEASSPGHGSQMTALTMAKMVFKRFLAESGVSCPIIRSLWTYSNLLPEAD